MQLGNIKDLLLKSLRKTWKQNQIMSSIIYKSIKDDFLENKKIDITPYIINQTYRRHHNQKYSPKIGEYLNSYKKFRTFHQINLF